MTTAGIIGGVGPESTIVYYRMIVAAYRERKADGSYPSVVINSIDMTHMLKLVGAGQTAELTSYLLEAAARLQRAGADFGLIASNTPHLVFDDLRRQSSLPLISIVEAAAEAARVLGLRRVGLFGTRYTMQAGFFSDVFARGGIDLFVPSDAEQAIIHDKYMNELVNGVVRSETRAQLLAIARAMRERDGIDGLVLGGTELSLILNDSDGGEMPFLDTTRIHVAQAVERLAV
jgi:aspartate racemase